MVSLSQKIKARKVTRKKNPSPLGFPVPGDPGYVAPKVVKRRVKKRADIIREAREKRDRESAIKKENYKTRAKRMRGLFGDIFKAKDGYDLRKVASWTPAQKAKITKYFRVIAPRITGDFVVKRYRRQDSIDAAVSASLQEKRLAGQTGVAFSVLPGDKLQVKVKRRVKFIEKERIDKNTGEVIVSKKRILVTTATVAKRGLQQVELRFDRNAFLEDPDVEIDRVLGETNANVFRVLVGGQQQNKTLTRSMVRDEIFKLIRDYHPDNIQRDQDQRPFDDWLNGLVAYPGSIKKTLSGVDRYILRNERQVAKREIARLNKLAIDHGGKGYKATIDKQVAIRRKRKGLPPLPAMPHKGRQTKRGRLTGRR